MRRLWIVAIVLVALAAPAIGQMDLSVFFAGNLGHNAGVGTDGCLAGTLTASNPSKGILETVSQAVLAYADDGGAYTDETTPANEATADDMTLLPATPAVNDAYYFGHATKQFDQIDILSATQGVGTWTVAWEYWNGTAWAAVTGLTDGTTGLTAAVGLQAVTYTLPTAWAQCTVDAVNGYWIRVRVATYAAKTTVPLANQAWVLAVAGSETYTDDTTDLTDAGADDVALLPAHVAVGDAFYIGYASKFCKIKATIGTAKVGGTGTYVWQYWNGTSWATLTCQDDTTLLVATAGTNYVSWTPPADWAANTAANGPDGEAGYFIRFTCTVLTVQPTTIPLGSQAWALPLNAGDGIVMQGSGRIARANLTAQTASGTANDTVLLVVNVTRGTCDEITWTGGDTTETDATLALNYGRGDKIAIVQVAEDGTTEFANANILLKAA
ncbi:MAG TPA: hypothetical protein VM243_01295 [Phycisphaerae bacterium]|nr:hypothetical protein [Phycisphaerae bacterium]